MVMTETRRGAQHHWSGPHLPRADARSRTNAPDQELADPANGETVPRCATCGFPDRARSRLMNFELRLRGKRAGRYPLCERCFARVNPPPLADPLDVTQNA